MEKGIQTPVHLTITMIKWIRTSRLSISVITKRFADAGQELPVGVVQGHGVMRHGGGGMPSIPTPQTTITYVVDGTVK